MTKLESEESEFEAVISKSEPSASNKVTSIGLPNKSQEKPEFLMLSTMHPITN
jgi:hypothetical protein